MPWNFDSHSVDYEMEGREIQLLDKAQASQTFFHQALQHIVQIPPKQSLYTPPMHLNAGYMHALLHLDHSTKSLEGLNDLFRLLFRHALLHHLRRAFHELLAVY